MADIIQLTETPPHLLPSAAAENEKDESASDAAATQANGTPEEILRLRIIKALSGIYDPEIPVNIYELGLIYDVHIDASNNVDIQMTLTSPACPVAGSLPPEVEQKVQAVPGVNSVRVELVWDPPYNMEMMSDAARLKLGLL